MPVRINQPIQQATVLEDFTMFLDKYTNRSLADEYNERKLLEDEREEAEEAMDETVRNELEFELPGRCTVEYDSNEDGKFTTVNGDDFVEWLLENYEVRPR